MATLCRRPMIVIELMLQNADNQLLDQVILLLSDKQVLMNFRTNGALQWGVTNEALQMGRYNGALQMGRYNGALQMGRYDGALQMGRYNGTLQMGR
jgi:hypothetical protein